MISPGARVDHWTLTDQTTGSPWLQTEVALPARLMLRAGAGVYQQFPDFQHVVGAFAGNGLAPERSIHGEVSIEHRLSASVRAQVALYHREDEDVIRRTEADTRLVAGRVVRGSATAPFDTRLDGYARGVELRRPAELAIGVLGLALVRLWRESVRGPHHSRILLGRSRSAAHPERLPFLPLHAPPQRERQVPHGE